MKRSIISGGFDPIHQGHLIMMQEAKKLAKYLIVIINNDNWLIDKKGFVFMPQDQRWIILYSIKYVDEIIFTQHKIGDKDRSVNNVLTEIRTKYPDDDLIFCNGGDRYSDNIPEIKACEYNKIKIQFGIGGEKLNSSSDLVLDVCKKIFNKVIKNIK